MKYKTIFEWLLLIYILFTLLFPQMVFNKLCFVIIVGLYFFTTEKIWIRMSAPFVIFLIFCYGFILSFFTHSNEALAIQFMLAVFALIMIFPIVDNNIDIENSIRVGGGVLVIVDLLYVLHVSKTYIIDMPLIIGKLYEIVELFIPDGFFQALNKYGEAAVGQRGFFGDFDLMAHIGTISFLYLPTLLWFEDALKTKKIIYYILFILSMLAIFFSTSRALLLVTVGMMFFIFIETRQQKITKYLFIFLALLVVLYIGTYLFKQTEIFSIDEVSNSVKIGHIKSAFSEISIQQLLFGRGLASFYFSSGVKRSIEHTEITILDYIRYFGAPFAFLIYFKLVCPLANRYYRHNHDKTFYKYLIIFSGYLVISVTNPVLMNSMGIIVILWYWTKVVSLHCNKHC